MNDDDEYRTVRMVDQCASIYAHPAVLAQTVVTYEERTEYEIVVNHHSSDEKQKPGQLQQKGPAHCQCTTLSQQVKGIFLSSN